MRPGVDVRLFLAGDAAGPVIMLGEPLSFWGGFDLHTGAVIDRRHPALGRVLSGAILLMPSGRGSSSSSSVLAEAIRAGTAPAAIITERPDPILVLGAVVAHELYGITCPIGVIDEMATVAAWPTATLTAEGTLTPPPSF
jgi:predicted aconitase with swiveling domain